MLVIRRCLWPLGYAAVLCPPWMRCCLAAAKHIESWAPLTPARSPSRAYARHPDAHFVAWGPRTLSRSTSGAYPRHQDKPSWDLVHAPTSRFGSAAETVQEDALFSLRSSACKHPPASAFGQLRLRGTCLLRAIQRPCSVIRPLRSLPSASFSPVPLLQSLFVRKCFPGHSMMPLVRLKRLRPWTDLLRRASVHADDCRTML